MKIHPQLILKNKYPMFVILPYDEYENILEALEDKTDIKAIEAFHATNQETFSMETAQQITNGASPIQVFRELRNMSQSTLAKKVGISRQYLNQIENKTRAGSAKVLKNLASVLEVDVDLLIS